MPGKEVVGERQLWEKKHLEIGDLVKDSPRLIVKRFEILPEESASETENQAQTDRDDMTSRFAVGGETAAADIIDQMAAVSISETRRDI